LKLHQRRMSPEGRFWNADVSFRNWLNPSAAMSIGVQNFEPALGDGRCGSALARSRGKAEKDLLVLTSTPECNFGQLSCGGAACCRYVPAAAPRPRALGRGEVGAKLFVMDDCTDETGRSAGLHPEPLGTPPVFRKCN
jgi:hypothetical protein